MNAFASCSNDGRFFLHDAMLNYCLNVGTEFTNDVRSLIHSSNIVDPDILVLHRQPKKRVELVRHCVVNSINHVFSELGLLPHYKTFYLDPVGFGSESSICSMPFRKLTKRDSRLADDFRDKWRSKFEYSNPVPRGTKYVLLLLQILIGSKKAGDVSFSSWDPFILDIKSRVAPGTKIIVRPHPFSDSLHISDKTLSLPDVQLIDKRSSNLQSLIVGAESVYGVNSTSLLEACLIYGKQTFVYGDGFNCGHDRIFPRVRLADVVHFNPGIPDPDYVNWFLFQLLARQFPKSLSQNSGDLFDAINRMSFHSFMRYGQSIFQTDVQRHIDNI